jgi:hypothetical protein
LRGQEELMVQIFQAYVERTYKGQAIPGQTDANRLEACSDSICSSTSSSAPCR